MHHVHSIQLNSGTGSQTTLSHWFFIISCHDECLYPNLGASQCGKTW